LYPGKSSFGDGGNSKGVLGNMIRLLGVKEKIRDIIRWIKVKNQYIGNDSGSLGGNTITERYNKCELIEKIKKKNQKKIKKNQKNKKK